MNPLIRPFAALRPLPGRAQEVVAPPYDVLNSDEARAAAVGRPLSFLHISKAEIDLPQGTDVHSERVYTCARENFERLRADGVLRQDAQPSYYLYQLVMGRHEQNGVVAVGSVTAYEENRIRRHELTRPDKEDDRVRQIDVLKAQTGPVLLTYRARPAVSSMLAGLRRVPPETEVILDGVRHRLWPITDAGLVTRLTEELGGVEVLYIADGHHRSAAAARVARLHAQEGAQAPDSPYRYFLAVLFPDTEMRILDYNRVIQDLNGQQPDEFRARLAEAFTVRPSPIPVKPNRKGEFGMYLDHAWYRLRIRPQQVPDDPVQSLDVSLLDRYVLAPLLAISDPRRDRRIDFVGGIRGLSALERRVDQGGMAVAFSLFPTALGDLMKVADAGQIMPPKSTWFEPKLADGLVSHLLA
ncbi:MAG: DUF1015 domain-containing protein [Acidiferrobacteraceae bacterium]